MEMTEIRARELRADWMRYARVQMDLEEAIEENLGFIKEVFLMEDIDLLRNMAKKHAKAIALHFSDVATRPKKQVMEFQAKLMALNGQIDYLIRCGKAVWED